MLYGAAGAGARVMTSSSSPGVSLMQEGISYMAGAELPCVIVNMMRGGPGLGSIQPSQTDYFQSTRGGGNGDYRTITLAPSSVQELVNLIELVEQSIKYIALRFFLLLKALLLLNNILITVNYHRVHHDFEKYLSNHKYNN